MQKRENPYTPGAGRKRKMISGQQAEDALAHLDALGDSIRDRISQGMRGNSDGEG